VVRKLLLGGRALQLPIGWGKSRRPGLLRIAQIPESPATDKRGPIDLRRETAPGLFVGQDIGRQRQTTSEQPGHHAVGAHGAEHAIECLGRGDTAFLRGPGRPCWQSPQQRWCSSSRRGNSSETIALSSRLVVGSGASRQRWRGGCRLPMGSISRPK
jgi:hypothetical protein